MFTAFMVIFFGGLTAYFNDERFFKAKTSIVYGAIAGILTFGLWRGQSYLEWVMGETLPANEVIWRTMSTDTWVKLETFAFPVVMMVLIGLQFMALQKFLIEPEED